MIYAWLAVLILPGCVAAQGLISTIAGGAAASENVKATLARLDGLSSLAVDAKGNAYVSFGARIHRIDANSGLIKTIAGNGQQTPLTDGAATQVALANPSFLTFDSSGNLI